MRARTLAHVQVLAYNRKLYPFLTDFHDEIARKYANWNDIVLEGLGSRSVSSEGDAAGRRGPVQGPHYASPGSREGEPRWKFSSSVSRSSGYMCVFLYALMQASVHAKTLGCVCVCVCVFMHAFTFK